MTSFTIEVQDEQVRAALKALAGRVNNMEPVLISIGEGVLERTKARFATSTGPDGVAWKPNTAFTLEMFAAKIAEKTSYRKKSGALNKRGAAAVANKKPLIGESKQLSMQIVARANANALTVGPTGVTTAYAAIQQFGGKTGAKSWTHGAMIPARPFLPIHQDGTLYPDEQAEILREINEYLFDRL